MHNIICIFAVLITLTKILESMTGACVTLMVRTEIYCPSSNPSLCCTLKLCFDIHISTPVHFQGVCLGRGGGGRLGGWMVQEDDSPRGTRRTEERPPSPQVGFSDLCYHLAGFLQRLEHVSSFVASLSHVLGLCQQVIQQNCLV